MKQLSLTKLSTVGTGYGSIDIGIYMIVSTAHVVPVGTCTCTTAASNYAVEIGFGSGLLECAYNYHC